VGDKAAGFMLTGTLACFGIGRFSSAWLMKHFHARAMLGVYSLVNMLLCLVAVTRPGWIGVGCLLVTSIFMSIMYPTIFALAIKGMGAKTKTAGSIVVMAMIGGAVLTKLMGFLSVSVSSGLLGLQVAYLVPIGCYIGIGLYAWLGAGYKVRHPAS
jgi:FHS family L-fucose permease-like MFS transporter